MDSETGAPYAYMSANVLSAMRTGAVPGLGVRYLSVKNPETVTIVGPGVMGRTAMLAFTSEKNSIRLHLHFNSSTTTSSPVKSMKMITG